MRNLAWLLPILAFHLIVCAVVVDDELEDDQARYVMYARNLLEGTYAPTDTLYLWNGPGYPLLLAPFLAAEVPPAWLKFLNPFLIFGAVCFLYFALRQYLPQKKALAGAYVYGLYVPYLWEMTRLLTESLTIFVVAGFAFFLIKWFREKKTVYAVAAGFFCSYAMLTRVMFGYVATFCLILSLVFFKLSKTARRAVMVFAVALLFCLPYLVYTYRLTGKVFYWSNAGGYMLYWMSVPYPQEYGEWKSPRKVFADEHLKPHRELFYKAEELNYVQRDELFRKAAIANIRQYPLKYCLNWVANVGRIWYTYPFSYKYQRPHTLFYMVPNSFLLASLLFCCWPLWKQRRKLPGELVVLITFVTVFLAASSLIDASQRYLTPLASIFILVMFFTAFRLLEIRLCKEPNETGDE